jgi:hypothetical protein
MASPVLLERIDLSGLTAPGPKTPLSAILQLTLIVVRSKCMPESDEIVDVRQNIHYKDCYEASERLTENSPNSGGA